MFRFEGLEVWKRSIKIIDEIFDIADCIEDRHKYRFAEQLRAASLSISNNIAEGSGSTSKKEFRQYLNHSHRSIFETFNMIFIATRRKYITESQKIIITNELEEISKMVIGFSSSLSTRHS
ncbi:MAG: four helix bundle protein [Bacteroidetes bacterium]|nr:four helix bundle protein [Bacteroidota bacterium]MBU1423792.1 four helix bundle protein [Bacteroidota bacterium]MBU2636568.1 four helix bundle protein [Bacteroidota bacterium]